MRIIFLLGVNLVLCFLCTIKLQAQTSITSGNWNDGTVWSTGTAPGPTSTVNANHPLILNANINITSGTYNMSNYVTDLTGGTAYNLTMSGGTLEVKTDTTTFEGTATFSDATVIIRSGAALILGATTLNNDNIFLIEAGAFLIINGTFLNSDNQGSFLINGLVYVFGDYVTNNGNIDVTGTGDIITTGTIFNQGSSSVFGSSGDCSSGPCSGRNLCGFQNTIMSDQAICPGSAANTLVSVAAPTGTPTYVWQSSTISATSGFANISGATSETYLPGIPTQTTWYRRIATRSGCSGTSAPVKITLLSANGWRGTTSSDWNTASNWCSNAVPTSTTDVEIRPTGSGIPNSPVISTSAVCKDITINPAAQVTVNGTSSFAIYGNMTNNGTLATNSSTVTFAGSASQTLNGTPINFYNLTINNSSPNTVVVNTFINVTNQLNLSQGNINLSGYNFTLGINTGSPGSLTRTAGTFYNGNLTRWLSGSAITIGNSPGLFPVGTATNYRPMYIGHGGITGGTMRVSHTDAPTVSNVSVNDAGTAIILRHDSNWRVTTADGLNGSNIFLRAEGTGYGIIDDLNHLRLMLVNSVIGSHEPNPSTPTPPITNAQVTRTGLTQASLNNTFYLGSINSLTPLPLTLLSFTGSWSTDGVLLEWKTYFEENFDYFVLERSTDGVLFRPVGRIGGTGEKNIIVNHYEYLDTEAHGGRYYYRLNQVDIDKSFEYSKVITVVTGDRGESFTLFPNPVVDNKFTVKISSELSHAQLVLYDQYGKIYVTADLVPGEQEIFIGNTLSNGVYFVKVLGLSTPKIVKLVINN